jgi:ATP-dependent DNA helicase RecG
LDNAIARLLKVLALEKKQGHRNKAVIGGLDKFVSRWEPGARAEVNNQPAMDEIVSLLLGYPAIEDTAMRARILDQVIRRANEIDAAVPDSAPAPEFAPAPAPPTQPEAALEPPSHATAAANAPEGAKPEKPRERETPVPAPSKPFQAGQADSRAATPAPVDVRPSGEPVIAPIGLPPAERAPERIARPPREAPASSHEAPAPPPRPAAPPLGLDAPVTRLPAIGPAYAQKLAKLGVHTVRDLLYLLPNRYDDFSQLRTIDRLKWGEEVTVIGTVWDLKSRVIGEDRRLVTAVVGDGTGEMQMSWFNPFVERQLRTGHAYAFSGKVDNYRHVPMIRNPQFEPLDRNQLSTGRLAPVYPLTEGISMQWLRGVLDRTVRSFAAEASDFLPEEVRRQAGLLPLTEALTQIHFPDNHERLAAAHRRLSFDEFFVLQLGVLAARRRFRGATARSIQCDDATLAAFTTALPFELTAAQRRALSAISGDLAQTVPMSRLLQGDVGSGKTAVAAAALWLAVANGTQGAIMAPTEILAEQHARAFGKMFENLPHPSADRPVKVVLLTGAMRGTERADALAALAAGDADIAIGTHALIQGGIAFRELTVAVVDEQHRFGVEQRAALRQKGVQPHMLVMSATPIPRSLALTVYGDLDISVIDEMPAGRTPIKAKWLTTSQRERAYDFIRRQAASGRQAFIIYPLVEETENSEARAAVEEHARLKQTIFPDLRVELLHGRMRGEEKDRVMRAFSAGESDVLVATSVVEVGIDVPNATVIMIEGAERFGLAQLHQFRGRVGRGEYPSYCILISDATEGDGIKRLQALENSTDGFALAQIDLEMRGPGDFFGTRQSGLPPLHAAQLSDLRTLEDARTAAQRMFEADPELLRPEHRALAAQVAAFWQNAGDVS